MSETRRRQRLVRSVKALLDVLEEADISCRFSKSGGCESVSRGEPCEMCQARGLVAAEGRS